MHFAISDTQKFQEENGSSYTAYNLYINGMFHCSVRYKQLHSLHQQLSHDLGGASLPSFPPKRFFSLSPSQIEDRRLSLERYILELSQDPRVLNNDIFNGWLVWAQNETQRSGGAIDDVPIDIYLMDGQKYNFRISPTLQTNDLLEKVCQHLNLGSHLVYYFGLFLVKKDDKSFIVAKKLQDFESPYISQKCSKIPLKIMLRKSYWDVEDDDNIIDDKCGLNLVYIQTVTEIQRSWILANREMLRQLAVLQSCGAKKEYIDSARTLKYYGYMQFQQCICNFPEENTPVLVAAGNRELNFRIHCVEDGSYKEGNFKITRIRCWRISSVKPPELNVDKDLSNFHQPSKDRTQEGLPKSLELSFEYLMNKEDLRWIKVVSHQAVLMSLCLQGMVQQLLSSKNGSRVKKPMDRIRKGSLSYMKRDGSNIMVTLNHTGEPLSNVGSSMSSPIGELSWRSLCQRETSLENEYTQSEAKSSPEASCVENRAFAFNHEELE